MNKPAPTVYWGCLRKVRYAFLDKAIEAARKRQLRYYYCDCCLGYHLTKSTEYGALAPEPPKKAKVRQPVGYKPRLRATDNRILEILREDLEYCYVIMNKKNQYRYFHVINSPWEKTDVENELRIKKVALELHGYRII